MILSRGPSLTPSAFSITTATTPRIPIVTAKIAKSSWTRRHQGPSRRSFSSAAVASSEPSGHAETPVITPPVSTDIPRGDARTKLNISVGDEIEGFKVTEKQFVAERNLTAYRLLHAATGAEHVHLECNDMENAFCVSFRTLPDDNSGIPHVLEHLVLCGSKHFPIRDPFFEMQKRSLSTFMNAWTGPDYTAYPFATQNLKDYYNLMAVYLDAVYYPNLDSLDFMQEGIRLHVDAETKDITYKGVVYNEMKGAVSDAGDKFYSVLHSKLDPEYSHEYGGDPVEIRRSLNYEKLKAFHKTFYHPSNSYTITYGDLPLEPHLKFIKERLLDKPEFKQATGKAQSEKLGRWTAPQRFETTQALSPLADPERQTKVATAWLLNDITDTYETLVMSIIGVLLASTPATPLYKALLASNIGNTYSPGTGYSASCRRATFSVGLSDIAAGDVERVEAAIGETLMLAAQEPFPQEQVQSVLHQIEFGQKHVKTNFGISLASGISHAWMHGGSPLDALTINDKLDRLKADLAKDPMFLQKKIKKWLVDNPHRLTVVMRPDEDYSKKETELESEDLAKATARLQPEDVAKLTDLSAQLTAKQETESDSEVLPKVTLADIDRKLPITQVNKDSIKGVKTHFVPQPTNGLVYFNAQFDVNGLPEHLLPYVPLFTSSLTQMGAGNLDYVHFSQQLELLTGSFSSFNSIIDSPSELGKFEPRVFLKSSALQRNVGPMFDLWKSVLEKPRFHDTERLRTLIKMMAGNMHHSLVDSGHSYAVLSAASKILPGYDVRESWSGFSQYHFIKALADQKDLSQVTKHLNELLNFVVSKNKLAVAINAEEKLFTEASTHVGGLIGSLNDSKPSSAASKPTSSKNSATSNGELKKTFFKLPVQVNFVANVYAGVPYTHPDYSVLDIMSRMMSHEYLHNEIREKGGAYGGGADQGSGSINFYAYRDPNVLRTLGVFDNAAKWLKTADKDWEEIMDEAKLSIFSSLDAPVAPSKKGLSEFYYNLTYDMRQKRRERVLDATLDDVKAVVDKYLSGTKHSVAVVGTEAMASELASKPDWEIK